MTRTVLVTDGEQRAALAIVRSLGMSGHRVFVGAREANSLAGASRFCSGSFILPEPMREPILFMTAIREATYRFGADVLIPVSEASLLVVLPNREQIAAALPFPAAEQFAAICDKALVMERAASRGIAVPFQLKLVSADSQMSLDGLPYPLVVKPSRSVIGSPGARFKVSVAYASDPSDLARKLAGLPPAAFPILLQQRIHGPGTAISLLLWDRKVRAAFGHRRLREKPPSGGVSVLRESISLDQDLLTRSAALLRDFDWQGVAMVEYKVEADTGRPFLMEINGRFWGSLQLAIDSGVDFPRLLVECAVGCPSDPVLDYQAGVQSRWELGDADNLLARLRHSRSHLHLSSDAPSRGRALWDFVSAFAGHSKSEVFRFDDPRPFARELLDWARRR